MLDGNDTTLKGDLMLDVATKSAICEAVDAGFAAQLAATADTVRYASTRGNERGVQEYMADHLNGLGYDVDHWRIEQDAIKDHRGYSPLIRDMDQAFNTVGTLKCAAPVGKSLIINGHVDTVPVGPADMWERPPFDPVIENGWMYGRAAGDMKAGLVAGIHAVESIRRAGFAPGADVCVQSVIEEESTGAGTLACVTRGYSADLALVPEPFGERLVRAQVGVVWCRISLLGSPAHAAYAQKGANAIDAAYRIIAGLRELEEALNAPDRRHPVYADFPHPINLNIGGIRGGEWPSSVPCTCEIELRCGLYPGQSPQSLQAEIADCVARVAAADPFLAQHPPTLDWHGYLTEAYVLEDADEVEAQFAALHHEVTGDILKYRLATGLTDGRFFGLYQNTPALIYGPLAENIHGFNERVNVESIRRCTKTIALFIADWCGLIPQKQET